MSEERIYVGNLTEDITERDIKKCFSKFHVSSIEIKCKNIGENENVFAYISVPRTVSSEVVQEMNNFELNGKYLKVQQAKENFLHRLKRERETKNGNIISNQKFNNNHHVLKSHDVDCITNNAHSNKMIETDKVKKPSNDVEVNYVLQRKHVSDIQRVQAVTEKNELMERKRKQISNALKEKDVKLNKKIRFDENENTVEENGDSTVNQRKLKLFDSSDDENDIDDLNVNFRLKAQISKSNTNQIIKVNASAAGDERFRLDARFMDDNNDDNEHENMDKQNEDDEKWKQLNILAEITGPLKQRTSEHHYQDSPRSFVRYDPTLEDHEKYTKRPSNKVKKSKEKVIIPVKTVKKTNAVQNTTNENPIQEEIIPVKTVKKIIKPIITTNPSKLKEVLKVDGNEQTGIISLRSMFSVSQPKSSGNEQGSVSNEEPSSSRINHLKIPPILNDDDDDASDEYEAEKPIEMEHATVASNEFIWTEKFFFEENDRRLDDEEAMKLFTTEIDEEEEEKVRLTLKSLLKVSKPNSNEQTDRKSAANRKPRFNVKRGGRFRFQNKNKKVVDRG